MLRENPPNWVYNYIGIPFNDRGRDRDGLDCWGLVRLVYAEQFGIVLPSMGDRYLSANDKESVGRVFAEEIGGGSWTLRDTFGETVGVGSREDRPDVGPKLGDVGVFRVKGQPWHVAIIVATDRILHIERGLDSICERFTGGIWDNPDRLVGWFGYAGPVDVSHKKTVLDPEAVRIEAPVGSTLADIVTLSGHDPADKSLRVYLRDEEISREHWNLIRPKPGQRVLIARAFAGGGGGNKNFVRILAIVAVIVASIFLGPEVAVAFGYTGTGSAAALATAGIALVGTLAINALIPPPSTDLSGAGDGIGKVSPTITGSGNNPRPFAPIPVVLGTHRITPPYGARPFSEIVGSDQYLRLLFVCGYGRLDLTDLRIGDTPIEEFEGVEIEIKNGSPEDDPIRLYPNTVFENSLAVLIPGGGTTWVTRTSADLATELSIDITFPRGLFRYENDGSYTGVSVSFELEYSPAGANLWTSVNTASPVDQRLLDFLFRTPEVMKISEGYSYGNRIAFGTGQPDPLPSFIPTTTDSFSVEIRGWITPPAGSAGTWQFAIDCSDAGDLEINGRTIATFYGSHGPAGDSSHSGEINLIHANYPFKIRFESRSGTPSLAFYWKAPGASAFSLVPAAQMKVDAYQFGGAGTGSGYRYRTFNTFEYSSASIQMVGDTPDQIRKTISWAVAPGRYDIRIKRVTPDSTDDRVLGLAYLTALRSIIPENPVKIPNLALVALRIRATDQLNGPINDFNLLATSILPDYDASSGEWIEQATSNPASCYRAVLQGPANARPIADSRLYLGDLQDWHTSNVENGLEFNAVYDFEGTVFERLQQIASAGRAAPAYRDGKHSIVRDRIQTVPIQHFTPRNSRSFRGRRLFLDLPHALRVTFLNREKEYIQDERIVLDDGYTFPDSNGDPRDAFGVINTVLPTATRFEVLELFGVTDPDNAWRHGRYHIAVGRLRPETFDLDVDFEHLACTRGDLVLVTHDVPLLGLSSGRVLERILNGAGLLRGLVLDDQVTMVSTAVFGIRVRLSDGTSFFRGVVAQEGERTSVYFESAVPIGEPWPNVGDLYGFGYRGLETREYVIKAITMGGDLSATLTLLDYAPAVLSADVGVIPPFDSGISKPPDYRDGPEDPVIEQIRSDDFVAIRGPDGTFIPRIVLYLRAPSTRRRWPNFAQIRYRRVPASGIVPPDLAWVYLPDQSIRNLTAYIPDVVTGATYQINLRTVDDIGRVSRWVYAAHMVVGHTLPPPDVQDFDVTRLSDGTRHFTWDLGSIPPDIVGVKIRYGRDDGTDLWEDLSDLTPETIEGSSPYETNSPPAGTWLFGIKMVDSQGLESQHALFITRTLGQPRVEGVAISIDPRVDHWPGAKTACYVNSSDGGLYARGRVSWANLPHRWSDWTSWTLDPEPLISYEHLIYDAGFIFDFEPSALVETDGAYVVFFDYSEDGTTWNGYEDIRALSSETVRGRYVKFLIQVQADGENPIPAIRQFVLNLRAETIVEDIQDIDPTALSAEYRVGTGDFRIPISSAQYSAVRNVSLSFNGSGAGWTWEIVDRERVPGPRVRIYQNGTLGNTTVDAIVRGLRAVEQGPSSPVSVSPDYSIYLDFSDEDHSLGLGII